MRDNVNADSQFLVFRLYGAMASWGVEAVGEQRSSASHPSKSAVLGIVAAALGIRRTESEALLGLDAALGFAVVVDAVGESLRDFHTVQAPPSSKQPYVSRRHELVGRKLYTVLSNREYRVDGLYRIALWPRGEPESLARLGEIVDALQRPRFVTYLGRKSCAPGLPYAPTLVTAQTLVEAFQKNVPAHWIGLEPLLRQVRSEAPLYWEDLDPARAGVAPVLVMTRPDRTASRERWQFAPRTEYSAAVPAGTAADLGDVA